MANRWVQLRSLPSPSSEGSGVGMAPPSLSVQRQEDWLLCLSILQALPLSTNNPHFRPSSSRRPDNSQKKRFNSWGSLRPPSNLDVQLLAGSCPSGSAVPKGSGCQEPLTLGVGSPKQVSSRPMELFMKKGSAVNDVPRPPSYVHPGPQNVTIFGNRDFADVIS